MALVYWITEMSVVTKSMWTCAGTAHIVAVLLVLSRLAFVLGGCRFRRYRLQSIPRIMQCTGIAAAAVCLLVELFQLNARIAADPSPLINGDIAPFEWAGEASSLCPSWAGQCALSCAFHAARHCFKGALGMWTLESALLHCNWLGEPQESRGPDVNVV